MLINNANLFDDKWRPNRSPICSTKELPELGVGFHQGNSYCPLAELRAAKNCNFT